MLQKLMQLGNAQEMRYDRCIGIPSFFLEENKSIEVTGCAAEICMALVLHELMNKIFCEVAVRYNGEIR